MTRHDALDPDREPDWAALAAELAYLDALPRPDLPLCPAWCTRAPHAITGAAIDVELNTARIVHRAEPFVGARVDSDGEPLRLSVAVDQTQTIDLRSGAHITYGPPELALSVGVDGFGLTADQARALAGDLADALTAAADTLDAARRATGDEHA